MPAQGSEATGLSARVGEVRAHVDAIVRLQAELGRRKARPSMIGGGIAFAGALILVLALLVGLAAAVAGIATVLDVWLAILVMFGALLALGLVLVGVGAGMLTQASRKKAAAGADTAAGRASAVGTDSAAGAETEARAAGVVGPERDGSRA